ncbi:putative signal transducing protein [Aquirufa sp. Wall-65K1]
MIKDWVLLGSSQNGIDLELLKSMLADSYEIPAVVINKKISPYNLGVFELYVHQDHVDQAKLAIAETKI